MTFEIWWLVFVKRGQASLGTYFRKFQQNGYCSATFVMGAELVRSLWLPASNLRSCCPGLGVLSWLQCAVLISGAWWAAVSESLLHSVWRKVGLAVSPFLYQFSDKYCCPVIRPTKDTRQQNLLDLLPLHLPLPSLSVLKMVLLGRVVSF